MSPDLWLILGMMAVTLLPRVLPLLLPLRRPPPLVDRWLAAIPFAALGALIFPGILTTDPGNGWVGAAGGAAALLAALAGAPAWAAALAAVAAAALLRLGWF